MFKYITYNKVVFILFILNIILLFCICQNNGIKNELFIGLLISFIFYYIVVFIPNYLRKETLKRVFLEYYDSFKEDVLREFLHLTEFKGNTHEEIIRLKDTDKFIVYYRSQSSRPGQTITDLLMNNLNNDTYLSSRRIIVQKMSELQRELDYIVRSIGVEQKDLLANFRRIDRALQDGRYKENIDSNWEEEKTFAGSLIELLSGWNMIDGTHGDFIKKWVKRI